MAAEARASEGTAPVVWESWGRYPRLPSALRPLAWTTDFPAAIPPDTPVLAVGAGRSYGDVGLLGEGTLLATRPMDHLLHFDPATGVLRCEAGVTLGEILEFAVPRGFFLPVTPGTKYVTVGGAIANDIHGKNHHHAGTIGAHLLSLELARSDGSRFRCSPRENRDWFACTVGGLGLTGLITAAELRLRPIVSRRITSRSTKFQGLGEFLELSAQAQGAEYTVAWLDCIATGRNFARGLFLEGTHSAEPGPLAPTPEPRLSLPVDLPGWTLNRATVGLFNTLYYHRQRPRSVARTVDYEPWFYPLDRIGRWNRLYGRRGLLQFQCVLPHTADHHGMTQILKAITSSGQASFLAVLKVFGDVPSPGLLSFPMPGLTLALDFPIRGETTFDLLDRLAAITLDHGGRLYPAKDACMTPSQYRSFYPEWERFAAYQDPAFDSAFWRRVTGRG